MKYNKIKPHKEANMASRSFFNVMKFLEKYEGNHFLVDD